MQSAADSHNERCPAESPNSLVISSRGCFQVCRCVFGKTNINPSPAHPQACLQRPTSIVCLWTPPSSMSRMAFLMSRWPNTPGARDFARCSYICPFSFIVKTCHMQSNRISSVGHTLCGA